jgi:hypothetical protein
VFKFIKDYYFTNEDHLEGKKKLGNLFY